METYLFSFLMHVIRLSYNSNVVEPVKANRANKASYFNLSNRQDHKRREMKWVVFDALIGRNVRLKLLIKM